MVALEFEREAVRSCSHIVSDDCELSRSLSIVGAVGFGTQQCQLMVGFFAFAKTVDISVDKAELAGGCRFWLSVSCWLAAVRFEFVISRSIMWPIVRGFLRKAVFQKLLSRIQMPSVDELSTYHESLISP